MPFGHHKLMRLTSRNMYLQYFLQPRVGKMKGTSLLLDHKACNNQENPEVWHSHVLWVPCSVLDVKLPVIEKDVNHQEAPHILLSYNNLNKEMTWLWGSARVTTVGTVSSHHKRAKGLQEFERRIYEKQIN